MIRNKIKIICNSQANTLSYQFQNEQMSWIPVSRFSNLSEYITADIRQNASAILDIINRVYNPGNRGVDIFFVGPDKDFTYLCEVAKEKFSGENISCQRQLIKVAVAGKRGIGKTTMIEALAQKKGIQYAVISESGYRHYKSDSNLIEWFELEGIDLGMENIKRTERTVDEIAKQGLTMFIYCFNSDRVEQTEEQLIQHVRNRYPEISLLGILTNAVSMNDTTAAEKISRITGMKVLPIMAKEQKTRAGMVEAFGHEEVLKVIYGGM